MGLVALLPVSNATAQSNGSSALGKPEGFAFATHLGADIPIPALANDATSKLTLIYNGFLVGYQYDHFFVGVGVDFFSRTGRLVRTNSGEFSTKSISVHDERATGALATAEVQVALVRLGASRWEMTGVTGLQIGNRLTRAAWTIEDPRLEWYLAPGLRYWPHRSLAFNIIPFGGRIYHVFSEPSETTFVPFLAMGFLAVL